MCQPEFEAAWAVIESADISAQEYRAAIRMLKIARDNNGHFWLSREDACELCGVSWPSVCRMLRNLTAAGVLRHHTNNMAYIIFTQWAAPRTACASENMPCFSTRTAGFEDDDDAQGDEQPDGPENMGRASENMPCAQNTPDARGKTWGARPKVGRIGGIYSPTPNEETYLPTLPRPDEPPTHDPTPPEEQPLPEEQRRNYELLTDPEVGIDKRSARRFASTWHWPALLAVVCKWRRDADDGQVEGNGALHYRLRQGYGATLTPRDRASPLYQRHVPEEERRAEEMAQRMSDEEERRHKYIPDEYADIILG